MDKIFCYECESWHLSDDVCNDKYAPHPGRSTVYSVPHSTGVFHGYYDRGLKGGREITSKKQIREIEKRENKVYGGYEELNQEADRNKRNNEKAIINDYIKSTEEKLHKALRR